MFHTTAKEMRKGWGTYCSKACASKNRVFPSRINTDARTLACTATRSRYQHHHELRAAVDPPEAKAQRTHRRYKQYYAENKHLYYLARYKRRAVEKGTQHEHINRIKVFERDNWTCRYCGTRTSDTVKQGHPRKAILAHINALAAGGTHTLDNVCCLCHTCNTKDGVNQLPIQKRIF